MTLSDTWSAASRTVAKAGATAHRGGETFTFWAVEIYYMRDGKISERWAFFGRYRGDQALLRVMDHAQ